MTGLNKISLFRNSGTPSRELSLDSYTYDPSLVQPKPPQGCPYTTIKAEKNQLTSFLNLFQFSF